MKHVFTKLSLGIALSLSIVGCTDDFADLNTDPLALDTGAL